MKKIVLLCASGMSTSMLVKKMQETAKAENYDCEIAAYSAAEAVEKASDADVQIRFSKDKITKELPGVPVDAIEMRMYGRMDGKGALAFAKSLMKD